MGIFMLTLAQWRKHGGCGRITEQNTVAIGLGTGVEIGDKHTYKPIYSTVTSMLQTSQRLCDIG
jgi:hypothetical protein